MLKEMKRFIEDNLLGYPSYLFNTNGGTDDYLFMWHKSDNDSIQTFSYPIWANRKDSRPPSRFFYSLEITKYDAPRKIKLLSLEDLETLNKGDTLHCDDSSERTIDSFISIKDDDRIYSSGVPDLQAFFEKGKFVYGTRHSYPDVFFALSNKELLSSFDPESIHDIPYYRSVQETFMEVKEFKHKVLSKFRSSWLEFVSFFYATNLDVQYRDSIRELIFCSSKPKSGQ